MGVVKVKEVVVGRVIMEAVEVVEVVEEVEVAARDLEGLVTTSCLSDQISRTPV